MDPILYKAAVEGNTEVLNRFRDLLGIQFTTNKSSVLHVAAQFHDNTECVQQILNLKPSLIRLVNSKHETVLHIAARNGHSNIVRGVIRNFTPEEDPESRVNTALHEINPEEDPRSIPEEDPESIPVEDPESRVTIEEDPESRLTIQEDPESRVANESEVPRMSNGHRDTALLEAIKKQFLQMSNRHGDTALHEAARNNNLDVVKILIEEDPEFPYLANNFGETPLYIAAKEHHHDIVSAILEKCKSPAQAGPNGRTALHAAVISGCSDCTGKLLHKFPNLTMKADQDGWKPIHHAAHLDDVLCARQLLEADNQSMAYVTGDKNHNQTALHLAAREGRREMMEEILSQYPDCWEREDSRGRNILHIAVEHEKVDVIHFILGAYAKNINWFSNLQNQMDKDGHTPFNLAAASRNIYIANLFRSLKGE